MSDRKQPTQLVILAGGLGTRISEETQIKPKPMVEIGGHPIIWHIMKMYSHYGINEFVICLGYRGYVIKEYFSNFMLHDSDVTFDFVSGDVKYFNKNLPPWKVTLVDTGPNTMTGGRIKRVASHLAPDRPFCMTYGDGVSDVDISKLIEFHRSQGREATLTAVQPAGRFGATEIVDNRVRKFLEKPAGDGAHINGGFFVLEPSVIDRIEGDDTVWEAGPLEGLARDDQLNAFCHNGFWQPMDTLRDKTTLEELWTDKRAPWRKW